MIHIDLCRDMDDSPFILAESNQGFEDVNDDNVFFQAVI
jgi:hypothetical protein